MILMGAVCAHRDDRASQIRGALRCCVAHRNPAASFTPLQQVGFAAVKTLQQIIDAAGECELHGSPEGVAIESLVLRTDDVTAGSLFCCVAGAQRDGHDFAVDAVARGAVALVVERCHGTNRRRLLRSS